MALAFLLAIAMAFVACAQDVTTGATQEHNSNTNGPDDTDDSGVPGCSDTCPTANDGECDDGGADALYSICDFGTDCTDCGARNPDDCVPACTSSEGVAFECGRDGCGGSCGECAEGEACFYGACEACEPDCEGRSCGSDGCGGSCGECPDGQDCTYEGQCETCVPDCEGAECGSDGCGGSCAECAEGSECNWDGVCESCECAPGSCGYNACGEDCGDCPEGESCSWEGVCEACVPDCEGADCGDDGCGGSCGSCGAGQVCHDTDRVCTDGDPMCNDTCRWAGDGECDDGGAGCLYSLCEFGSDCADCGVRTEADRLPEGEGCGGSD